MSFRFVVALSLGSAVILAGAVTAQENTPPQQVVTAEPLPTSTETAPVTAQLDPLNAALQKILASDTQSADDAERADQDALAAFYGARGHAPLWVDDAGLNTNAKVVIAEIGKADDWGLEADAFVLPQAATVSQSASDPEVLANAESTLSLAVLKYASHARGGRIMEPANSLSSYLDRTPQLLEASVVLEKIAVADEPDAYLRSLHPQHPQFEKLRQKYLSLRQASAAAEVVRMPDGKVLVPGDSHPQVAILRKRLKVAPAATEGAAADETFFDETLKAAVISFQEENGMSPDGMVGRGTRAALNNFEVLGPEKLLANMEQWRWMPDDLGDLYVWVNIPEFTLRIAKDGKIIHKERAITGSVGKQTPVFSESMKMIVFRPRWNVPNSIKVRELWPSLARGGQSFARQGLRLSRNGRVINPNSVDWSVADIRNFDVYQPPSAGNALGVVKFAFPNKHLVYMHDTPKKSLFNETSRPFSHGCMRIRNPQRMAEILLSEDKGWDSARIDDLIENGPGNNEVELDRQIPVHVTYFTAWVDENGETQTAPDVYGHEKRIKLALAGQWQRIARGSDHLAPVKVSRNAGPGYWGYSNYGGGQRRRRDSVGDYVQSVLGGGF